MLAYILELRRGWPFKTSVCSAKSGLLSRYETHLRSLFERLDRAIRMLYDVRRGTQGLF